MLYVVEVNLAADDLARELNQMRTWLDHMKYQASGFRQIPDANICRIGFEIEQQATAFAQAFGGQILDRRRRFGGSAAAVAAPPRRQHVAPHC
jgi:hypothetical protein